MTYAFTMRPFATALSMSLQYLQRLWKAAHEEKISALVSKEATHDLSSLNLIVGKQIGKGDGGTVHKGHLNDKPVAIKVLTDIVDYQTESKMMQALQDISSPHIVKYYGHRKAPTRSTYYLVMEYFQQGSVSSLLHSYKSTSMLLPLASCYKILEGTAKGMFDMHKEKIAHSDLKWNNVMLADDDQVKLIDFGLSAYVSKELRPYLFANHDLNVDISCFGAMIKEIVNHTPEEKEHDAGRQELLDLADACKTPETAGVTAEKICQRLHETAERYASSNRNRFFNEKSENATTSSVNANIPEVIISLPMDTLESKPASDNLIFNMV